MCRKCADGVHKECAENVRMECTSCAHHLHKVCKPSAQIVHMRLHSSIRH